MSAGPLDRLAWVRRYQGRLTWGVVVLAVAAAGAWWTISSGRRQELQAGRILQEARLSANSGNLALAASDLNRLSDQFPRTRAAQQGAILLAQIRLRQGQQEQVVAFLHDFIDRGPRQEYRAGAWALLGAAYEDLSRPRQAAEAYQQASIEARFDFLRAQYLSDAGRAYWAAGDSTQALDAYRTIVSRYSTTPSVNEARVRLSELTGGGT